MNKIVLLLFLIFTNTFFAQLKTVIGETDYPFWIQVPKNEKTEKQPVLIVLHGKSLTGTDINKVKRYGVLSAINKGRNIAAIVVAPQLASGFWNSDKVLQLLEYVQENYNTDTSKIYVCGMSLGGYGTLHFVGKYPEKITAAVAICGGGFTKDACNLAKVPLKIYHGDSDKAVPISESSKIVNAIKECDKNAPCEFIIVKGGTHGSVERIFHEDAMINGFLNNLNKSALEKFLLKTGFLAQIEVKSPEAQKGFFVARKERPTEATFVAYKKPFWAEDLKRKAGLATFKKN